MLKGSNCADDPAASAGAAAHTKSTLQIVQRVYNVYEAHTPRSSPIVLIKLVLELF